MENELRKRRSDYGKKRTKPHKCSKCPYTHASTRAIETHYLNNHASEKERKEKYKYYCDKCYYGSMTEIGYKNHIKTKKHLHIVSLLADSPHD